MLLYNFTVFSKEYKVKSGPTYIFQDQGPPVSNFFSLEVSECPFFSGGMKNIPIKFGVESRNCKERSD